MSELSTFEAKVGRWEGEDGGEGSMEASRVDADLVMMLQAQILKSAFSSAFI